MGDAVFLQGPATPQKMALPLGELYELIGMSMLMFKGNFER